MTPKGRQAQPVVEYPVNERSNSGAADMVDTNERLHVARDRASIEPVPGRYINRELSWLDFNERVLALAEDEHRPLLERARFVAIFSANLDEFFQIRVAGLSEQVKAGWASTTPDGMT